MRSRRNRNRKKGLRKLTIVFIILDVLATSCFFIMYGPWDKVRNLVVTTAMKTMNHQYIAKVFYSQEQIDKIMSKNYFVPIKEEVDENEIVIDTKEKDHYDNKYDAEILTRENNNELYKIINLQLGGADAYLVAIYDPTKVQLISAKEFTMTSYERILTMCQRYNGVVCINGGGMVDYGTGSGIPQGYVIEDGKITWSDGDSSTTKGNIIGMTKKGILKLMSDATGDEALEAGVVDAMEFGPFLIVNGKAMEIVGEPWGHAPRVAIAQRKDGVILFLVSDGENYLSGPSLQDVIDILLKYGAYNAANLDGGHSTTLIVNNQLYNNPPAIAKNQGGRYVVTGWGLIP